MKDFSFLTLKNPVENIILKEKGSKFIGYAQNVNCEEDFKVFLKTIKDLHPKATHHCFAFRLGILGENFRVNDDGEPSGSAGLPILNQIIAKNLTQVSVIVLRYYGGTKLGVSGLIKAYKNCAKETLEHGIIVKEEPKRRVKMTFNFALQNTVFSFINKLNVTILEFSAKENCVLKLEINLRDLQNLKDFSQENPGISVNLED